MTEVEVKTDPYRAAQLAIRRREWRKGIDAFAAAKGTTAGASDRLLLEIARIRVSEAPKAISAMEAALIRDADGREDWRRYVVSPFLREGKQELAAAALAKLVEAFPAVIEDRRYLAGTLARLGRWDEATRQADETATLDPDNLSLFAARMRFRLGGGDAEGAASLARSEGERFVDSPGDLFVVLTALLRVRDFHAAARLAGMVEPERYPDLQFAAAAVQALLLGGQIGLAIARGEAALAAGRESAALRSHLGQALLTRGTQEDRTRALDHLSAGSLLEPDNARVVSLYGEALLLAGRYQEALAPLEKACTLAPDSEQQRGHYARALRYAGRQSEAADQFVKLVAGNADRFQLQRQAIGALTQAGRTDEAERLFDTFIQRRSSGMPSTFEAAFARISDRIDTAKIPQARLDWAWSLRQSQPDVDREAWERAARWGHLADHLILDWLECRAEQAEEAMALLADLSAAEDFLLPLRASGRGMVIGTAHIGPMYAGPLLLELLALPSRWLASTPSIARSGYASVLISTSDQTDAQIARASLKALQAGYAVGLAVDGAANPATPRIRFQGQQINYSNFAARLAHQAKVPSFFYAPRWENRRIELTLKMLPSPESGEEAGPYAVRWKEAYLQELRAHLGGPPEDLRLSGGLWRHIRDADEPRQ
jgi:tetratricopeptide (TPR) repeat protein